MNIRPKLSLKTTIFLCLIGLSAHCQHFGLSRLFYPNVTLRAEYMPGASAGGGKEFGLTRTSLFGLMPLKTEVEAGFSFKKKFDLRLRHTLLVANIAQLNPTINNAAVPDNGYKSATVGVVMVQASLKDKLWVYGLGGGITETNETFFTPQPFLWGGAARMRVLGLQTQIAYGTAIIYSQKFRIIPIFGINKKLGNHWRASALLPFVIDFNYKANNWFNVDLIGALGGYSGGFQQLSPTEKLLRRDNYQHVKFSIAANAHLFTAFNVSAEVGMTTFRQLRTLNPARETLATLAPAPAPYLGVSVRYITSRSKMSSKLTRKLGLGGDGGINW
jgi:hypothetical protein